MREGFNELTAVEEMDSEGGCGRTNSGSSSSPRLLPKTLLLGGNLFEYLVLCATKWSCCRRLRERRSALLARARHESIGRTTRRLLLWLWGEARVWPWVRGEFCLVRDC